MINRRTLLSGFLSFLGCGAPLHRFPFDPADKPIVGLRIHYYSVACFLIELGDVAILTDPFWSHLSFWKVAFGKTEPDPKQYTPYLNELNKVKAVLIGHSHYDHTLDLEPACNALDKDAKIYGSQTLAHIYAGTKLSRPLIPTNQYVANHKQPGEWLYAANGRIRILPILSDHPNQYLFFHLFPHKLSSPRTTPPRRASHFQEGITIAFLVDFMEGNKVASRIYIQTSTTGYPAGYFPKTYLHEKAVDVAILGVDCANIKAKNKPSIIDFIKPKNVIFCHWEDFFRTKSQPPREIVKVDLPKLKQQLPSTKERKYIFPYWDRSYYFPVQS